MVSILTIIHMFPVAMIEAVKTSHSSVTEAWISHVAAALEKSEIETNDVINSQRCTKHLSNLVLRLVSSHYSPKRLLHYL